jgi:choline dehydrogenase-like flavoprotein
MAAKFDLNDDGLFVIVGSGAGGGTLGSELARKGIKTVILEAGPRIEMEDFVNDEWESFAQLAWKDMRTTSGNWRVARDFPNLPAWIVKAVGGTTIHWAGASLRFQEHEFKTKTAYGSVKGANLLDWPLTLAELEPYYAKAEDKMGVTRTHGFPVCPATIISRYSRPAQKSSAIRRCIRAAWPLTRNSGTIAALASKSASVFRAASRAPNGRR